MIQLVIFINLFFVPLLPLYVLYRKKQKSLKPNLDLLFQYGIIVACNIPLSKVFIALIKIISGKSISLDSGYYTLAALLPTILVVSSYKFYKMYHYYNPEKKDNTQKPTDDKGTILETTNKTFLTIFQENILSLWKHYGNIFIWGIIGALVFLSIYGLIPLDVTYDHWIMNGYVEGDIQQHYAGWLAYRQSNWSFPLGKVDSLGGAVITYTDSLPLISIFFKVFNVLLPETFQFFGIYIFLCFILQGISSGMLINLFSQDKIFTNIGVVLFCYSPIMIERAFRHTALASHWLIIFMLYFYFKSRKDQKLSLKCCILPVLCIGIHPYFLPMVFGLMFAVCVELLIINVKTLFRSAIALTSSLAMTLGTGYLIGALGTTESLSRSGFGHYSMNLNSIVNPISCSGIVWSKFFKVLPQIRGNYDGFNYLGLGVILLLVLVTVAFVVKKHDLKELFVNNGILFLLSLAFMLFAVSNVVTLNGITLFKYPLPDKILSLAGIFRASSRMFYPVYYLLILAGINGINSILLSLSGNGKCTLLLLITVIQLIDISPALATKCLSFNKNEIEQTYETSAITGSALWNSVTLVSQKIRVLEPISNYKLAAFGEKYHLKPDISISNTSIKGAKSVLNSIYEENVNTVIENKMDSNAVYILSNNSKMLPLLVTANPNINVYRDKESKLFVITNQNVFLEGDPLDNLQLMSVSAADLTDDNWTNGISNSENQQAVLFEFSNPLKRLIDSSQYINCNGEKRRIIDVSYSNKWIHIIVDKDASLFAYPNQIIFEFEEPLGGS